MCLVSGLFGGTGLQLLYGSFPKGFSFLVFVVLPPGISGSLSPFACVDGKLIHLSDTLVSFWHILSSETDVYTFVIYDKNNYMHVCISDTRL